MKFWQALSYERTEDLVPLARACEELGFEGVLLADHVAGHAKITSRYEMIHVMRKLWTGQMTEHHIQTRPGGPLGAAQGRAG